jgi:hypothetical protein
MENYISQMVPKVIIDQKAMTIAELAPLFIISCSQMYKIAGMKVRSGEWEIVKKKIGVRYSSAYRPRKRTRGQIETISENT